MPDKQRVLDIVAAMPEGTCYLEIVQMLTVWYSDHQAGTDIEAGRFYNTEMAKQRVREMAGV